MLNLRPENVDPSSCESFRHSWRHHVAGLVALCMVVAIAGASAGLQHNASRMALNWLGAFVSGFLRLAICSTLFFLTWSVRDLPVQEGM